MGFSAEGLLRQACWLWRERKERVLLGAALLSTAGLGLLAWRLSSKPQAGAAATLTTLKHCIDQQSITAGKSGALRPLATEAMLLHDHDSQFWVAVIDQAKMKQKNTNKKLKVPQDALASPEEALVVSTSLFSDFDVLLNKFPVVPSHALLVSKQFVPQQSWLGEQDWSTFWAAVRSTNALGFYNCGSAAGASQPRRHMQLIPLASMLAVARQGGLPVQDAAASPRTTAQAAAAATAGRGVLPSTGLPVDYALGHTLEAMRARSGHGARPHEPFQIADYAAAGVKHAVAMLGNDIHSMGGKLAGARLQATFAAVAKAAGVDIAAAEPRALSIVLTPRWLLVAPRSKDRHGAVGLNSIGYAGMLLAKGTEALQQLSEPGAALAALAACSRTQGPE